MPDTHIPEDGDRCSACSKVFKNAGNACQTRYGYMHRRCYEAFQKGMATAQIASGSAMNGIERKRIDAYLECLAEADSILTNACRLLGQDKLALAIRNRTGDWQVAYAKAIKP